MAVEILGTRVLAPVFGAGIYVWAALLAATLCSLAVDYYVGGTLGDRHPRSRTLGAVLVAGGAALAFGMLIATSVLTWALSLGPRVGTLSSALILFGPVLTVLGMVSPIAVRLLSRSVERAGRYVGNTYAISTAGSLAGTFAVVFGLVPRFETPQILWGTAGAIAIVGALWLRRGGAAAGAAVASVCLLAASSSTYARTALPSHLTVVERANSPYGLFEVIDDGQRGIRIMRADHSIIGAVTNTGVGVFSYTHVLEALKYARPEATTMLQIGLGTGTLPTAMHRRGIRSDVVEIDPAVVRMAKAHFAFEPTGDVVVEDARTFLNRATKLYDLVVHDTFTGGVSPSHLLSEEVLMAAKKLLKPGGMLAVNLPGYTEGPDAEASRLVARTLRSIFPHVRVFRDSERNPEQPLANVIFLASKAPITFDITQSAPVENAYCAKQLHGFQRWEVLKTSSPGPLVTDDYNPLTSLQSPVAEAHYAAMNEIFPAAMWMPW